MFKKIFNILALIFLIVVLTGITAFAAEKTAIPNQSKVVVDNKEIQIEAYTIDQNNYFKLRDIAKVLNGTKKQYEVTWDQSKNAINIVSGSRYTSVGGELNITGNTASQSAKLSNSTIYLDGKKVDLTAYTINQNNYFKLRDLGEALDFGVEWSQSGNAISIWTDRGYEEEKPEEPTEPEEPVEPEEPTEPVKPTKPVVMLDAGHGGSDSGAVNGQHKEKEYALQMTLKLGEMLTKNGIEVLYTRTSDTYPTLADRVEMANSNKVDLFISVHLNSATSQSASGIETLIISKGGEAEKLAKEVQANMIDATDAKNRGVKEQNVYVLRKTDMPAILIETGFISNEEEVAKLQSEEYQTILMNAAAKGICNYLKIDFVE